MGRGTGRMVIDLPEEWGARMRISEVRAVFRDPKHAESVRAFVQVMWMNWTASERDARDRAAALTGKPDFHLGEVEGGGCAGPDGGAAAR